MNDVSAPHGAKDARQDETVAGSVLPGSGAVGATYECVAITEPEYAQWRQVDETERYRNACLIHGAAAVHSGVVAW